MQNIIITGFGMMGETHARAYAKLPQAMITAIVDSSPDQAAARASQCGLDAVPRFQDLATALGEVDADAVDICLPTDQHVSNAVLALEAGKHVFLEKPLALSLVEAGEIQRAWEKSGKFLQVGHCLRFWPEYLLLEHHMRTGGMGRLLSLTLQRSGGRPGYSVGNWLNDPERSQGAALDLHVHDTDMVLHLLGTPPAVFSRGTRDAGGMTHIFTQYLYPDVVVQAEGGWNYPAQWGFRMAFQAIFEHGTLEYDSSQDPGLRKVRDGQSPEVPDLSVLGQKEEDLGAYGNGLRYFLKCIESGHAPDRATLEQSRESLRVTLAEIQSADSGKIMDLRTMEASL